MLLGTSQTPVRFLCVWWTTLIVTPAVASRQPLSAHHSAPAYRFGADNTRAKQFSRGQGPGPGTYEPVGAIGSASRAKGPTIKGRQKFGSHTVAADSPGPGVCKCGCSVFPAP